MQSPQALSHQHYYKGPRTILFYVIAFNSTALQGCKNINFFCKGGENLLIYRAFNLQSSAAFMSIQCVSAVF